MDLDELRRQLLAEHDELRDRLAHIRRLAIVIEKGNNVADAEARLRAHIESLRDSLMLHIEREDVVLKPILRELDAWGPQRAEMLEDEHDAEHTVLFAAMEEVRSMRGPRRLANAARTLVRELGDHMEEEEVYLLAPDVLSSELDRPLAAND